jgi:S1-C subfamily serine protease
MSLARSAPRFALVLLLCLLAGVASARSGLVLKAAMGGVFWNPTLQSVHVAEVTPGSAAERAGFRAGDEIVQINDITLAGGKAKAMRAYWDALPEGKPARFVVRRDGRTLALDMVLGD